MASNLTHFVLVDVRGLKIANPKDNIFLNSSNSSLNLCGRIKGHGLTLGN